MRYGNEQRTRRRRVHYAAAVALLSGWLNGCGAQQTEPEAAPKGPSREERAAKAEARFAELSDAVRKLEQGEALDAVWLEKKLRKILELDPKHNAARFNLGRLKARLDEHERAKEIYRRIHADAPAFAPAAENLAAYYVQEGRTAEAVRMYRDNIERDPKNITSRLALARIEAQQGAHERAIELARAALQRKADALEAFRVLARSYRALGNIPMTDLIIGRGLKIDEEDIELNYLTAQILLEKNKLAEGVSKLKQLVALAPERLDVRAKLAEIALSYRDFGNAAQQYEAIAEKKPKDRGVQVALAVSYKGLGRYSEAKKIYQRLLEANPQDSVALWNLAALYHRHLNAFDKAIARYQDYREAADPGDKRSKRVPRLVEKLKQEKADLAAQKAREERERKRKAAIDAACEAVRQDKEPKTKPIGNEQVRIEVGWQLLTAARELAAAGQVEQADQKAACAFAVVPDTKRGRVDACAPMHVVWTQDLYQMGRIEEAVASNDAALRCDAKNPDARLIKKQLAEIMAQREAEAAKTGSDSEKESGSKQAGGQTRSESPGAAEAPKETGSGAQSGSQGGARAPR